MSACEECVLLARVSSINVTHLCLNGWLVRELVGADSRWAGRDVTVM